MKMKTIKKWFTLCLALVTAFSVLTVCASAAASGSISITAGDSIQTAPAVSFGKSYAGAIAENQSYYYYKFTIPKSGRVIYSLYSDSLHYVKMTFCDPNGNAVINAKSLSWNGSMNALNENGFIDLVAGTYYLKFIRRSDMGSNGEYTFSLGFSNADESFYETQADHNNYMGDAYAVSLNKWYTGQIADNDRTDYYRFTVSSAQSIHLQFYGDFWLVNIYVRDSNSSILHYKTYISRNDALGRIVYDVTVSFSKAGTYYLQVSEVEDYGSVTGTYQFLLGTSTLQEHIVSYKGNSGVIYSAKRYAHTGENITLPCAARAGYTFLGWSTQSNATTAQYKANSMYTVRDSITLYAVWSNISTPTTYTVTFNGNGGSVSTGGKTVNAGTAITLPSATRSGYTFLGWSESSGASSPSYYSGASYTVNKNVTLYAVWQYAPSTTQYTVRFDANGGSVSTGSKTVNADTAITLPSATRSGYTFLGWSENSNASSASYSAGASYTVSKNVTLYAVWQQNQNPDPNQNQNQNSLNVLQKIYDVMIRIINFFLKLLGAIGLSL